LAVIEKNRMDKKIAILRGINVGGKRKILMADLKLLFDDLGFINITTYIQSGNVIFNSESKLTDIQITEKIEKAITNKYGFSVPVIVKSAKEIEESIRENPFYQKQNPDINKLHLTLLKEQPTNENILKTESYNYEPDKFVIKGKRVFVFCNGKYHQSKLTNNFFENKLKVPATTRNWKTVLKLVELSKGNINE